MGRGGISGDGVVTFSGWGATRQLQGCDVEAA